MPKILNFVKNIHYYSKLFTGVLTQVNKREEEGKKLEAAIDDEFAKSESKLAEKIAKSEENMAPVSETVGKNR